MSLSKVELDNIYIWANLLCNRGVSCSPFLSLMKADHGGNSLCVWCSTCHIQSSEFASRYVLDSSCGYGNTTFGQGEITNSTTGTISVCDHIRNVCPSSLAKHIDVTLLQKVKIALARWSVALSDIQTFLCISLCLKWRLSPPCLTQLSFEGHEVWSPPYPPALHFIKLVGAWEIREEDLGLRHSLESTKWHSKHLLHHNASWKHRSFLLSRCSSSLCFSCAFPWCCNDHW